METTIGHQALKRLKTTTESSSACEATGRESGIEVVDLDEGNPVAVWAMVQYLYHLEYPDPTDKVERELLKKGKQFAISSSKGGQAKASSKARKTLEEKWRCMHRHAKIYPLGEKYGISGLKDFVSRRFLLYLSTRTSMQGLVAVVKEVYTGTPEEDIRLRSQMITFQCYNMNIVEKNEMRILMMEVPQFFFDVLLRYYRLNAPSR